MFNPIPKVTPEQEARTEFERINARELELETECASKRAGLAMAKTAAGSAIVDGGGSTVGEVVRLAAEVESFEYALVACHARRVSAIENLLRARAQERRQLAAEKRGELRTLEAKTGKFLQALSELEGVDYSSFILGQQPVEDAGEGFHRPRSTRLRIEAENLETQATELESRGVLRHGTVDLMDATCTEDLVRALLREEKDVPSVSAVLAWASACESAAAPRIFGDNKRRFRVVWRDGVIDREQSYVFVPELGRRSEMYSGVVGQTIPAKDFFDVPGGTFRA